MSIESLLERIAVALEAKTSAPTAAPAQPKTPKPVVSKPAAEPKAPVVGDEPAAEASEDTVANVVSRLLKAQKRDEAVALLKKYGATSVSGVKAAKTAEFIAEGLEILLGA